MQSERNIILIVIFAVCLGTFCNLLGNMTMLVVMRQASDDKNRPRTAWKAIAIQGTIAFVLLAVTIVMAAAYKTNVV